MVRQEPPVCYLRRQRRIPWREPLRIFGEGRGADHQKMCESRIRTGRRGVTWLWRLEVGRIVFWEKWPEVAGSFWIDQENGAGVSGGQRERSFVVWRNRLVPLKTLGMQDIFLVGKAGWRERMEKEEWEGWGIWDVARSWVSLLLQT